MFGETVFRSHPFFMMATRSSMSEMKAYEDKKKQTELEKNLTFNFNQKSFRGKVFDTCVKVEVFFH